MPRITLLLLLLLGLGVAGFVGPDRARAGDEPGSGTTPRLGLAPDGNPRTLAPFSTLWFQFNYGGDRSPVEIRLLDGGAPDIQLAVYTPDQIEQMERGEGVKPIGQARRVHGEPAAELHWVGRFNRGGTYFASVHNPGGLTYVIRVVALGSAVNFPRVTITAPESSGDAALAAPAPAQPAAHPPVAAPLPASLIADGVHVDVPSASGVPSFTIPLTARPAVCTPPAQMPATVTRSLALCPNQTYPPFRVTGSNLTVYGDATALVQAPPRGFGVTVTGNNVALVGLRVAAATHPADLNKWLCLFEACSYDTMYQRETIPGGIAYGGGILLKDNANAAVVNSAVWGGTIGVAAVRSAHSKIVGSNLSQLNGWGVLLVFSDFTAVVGNTFNDVNRACVGPDGFYYQSGCESAGFACVGCQQSIVASNHCERASNCYYATGDGGLPSNHNKFYDNYCAGASNNCFEITYSTGNEFDYNVATGDPNTGVQCTYPFWISGSIVHFGKHNEWACIRSLKKAEEESQNATNQPTEIRGLP